MGVGKIWNSKTGSTTIPHTASGDIANLTDGLETDLGRQLRDYTVERIVGNIQISAPAGSTAYDSAFVFLGIIPVSSDARTASAYPEPYSDNVPWLWTHGGQVFVPDNPSASLSTLCIPDGLASVSVDIRQRRRVKGDSDIMLVGYDDSGITGTLNIAYNLRTLYTVRV